MGGLELRVPKDRDGEFQTELFERYQRSDKALVLAMLQMYVEGVSTRKVSAISPRYPGWSGHCPLSYGVRICASEGDFARRPAAEGAGEVFRRGHRDCANVVALPVAFCLWNEA